MVGRGGEMDRGDEIGGIGVDEKYLYGGGALW